MSDPFAPKQTSYKGVVFRSKTEAIYARVFDLIGWTWEYEPEIPGWPHRPDFLMAGKYKGGEVCLFVVEIKPAKPTKSYLDSIERSAAQFATGFRSDSIVLFGNPWDRGDGMVIKMADGKWLDPEPVEWLMGFLIEALDYRFDLESPSEF